MARWLNIQTALVKGSGVSRLASWHSKLSVIVLELGTLGYRDDLRTINNVITIVLLGLPTQVVHVRITMPSKMCFISPSRASVALFKSQDEQSSTAFSPTLWESTPLSLN
jgi:hypothetical protein